jgi:hypothetical protein
VLKGDLRVTVQPLSGQERTKDPLVADKGDRAELGELCESEREGLDHFGRPKITPHRVDRDPCWNSSR